MPPNGQPHILPNKAKALAAYPHARTFQGLIFLSGVSSRRPDNTYEGTKFDTLSSLFIARMVYKSSPFI